MKPHIKRIRQTLFNHEFQGGYILNHTKDAIQLQLPPQREIDDLKALLTNLKEEWGVDEAKITDQRGKRVTVRFGNTPNEIPFTNDFIRKNTLKIALPTAFDTHELDFEDGASCHMLNGGAPRMGKTIFLLYVSSILYHQNNGHIQLIITSPKIKDFYPLMSLPNVTTIDNEVDFMELLQSLIDEYKARNKILYSPACEKATDSKSVKQMYPEMYKHFKPIFLIVDEYARFSDNKPIQKMVAELVQTAGYVNIHVIIATQRPDARQTLPANIKMGLMARICFRTADENNSIVILDEKGAESLPNIKGRAILRDGDKHTVQVPNITYNQCEKLLQPYKRESKPNENPIQETNERPENNQLANKIQNLFKESIGEDGFSNEQQPNERNKPSNEAFINGWYRLADTQGER